MGAYDRPYTDRAFEPWRGPHADGRLTRVPYYVRAAGRGPAAAYIAGGAHRHPQTGRRMVCHRTSLVVRDGYAFRDRWHLRHDHFISAVTLVARIYGHRRAGDRAAVFPRRIRILHRGNLPRYLFIFVGPIWDLDALALFAPARDRLGLFCVLHHDRQCIYE